MEFDLRSILLTICVGFFIYIVLGAIFRKKRPDNAPKIYRDGLWIPWLGSLLDFGKDPLALFKNAYDKYGEVFSIELFGTEMTFLCSSEGHEHFFMTPEDDYNAAAAYKFTIPTFGPGVVYDVSPKKMHEQFRFFRYDMEDKKFFHYTHMVQEELKNYFDAAWPGDSGETDLLAAMNEVFTLTSARCLMGPEIRAGWKGEYAKLYADLDKSFIPISFFFPNMPVPYARLRDKARTKLKQLFTSIITERREKNIRHEDFLQTLMESKYKDGTPLTDEEITGIMVALVLGGQHTSNVTGTWLLLHLIRAPQWLDKLRAEVNNLTQGGKNALEYEQVKQMSSFECAINETLRLHPPFIQLARRVLNDVEYKGTVIRKGTLVCISPLLAQHLPSMHEQPEDFDPSRFLPENSEKIRRHTWIPFGGGKHICIGRKFALFQLKLCCSYLLQNYDLEMVSKDLPKTDYSTMVVGPVGPVMIRYKRRK